MQPSRTPLRQLLTVPVAQQIIGGSLSFPSKMPCAAWGISALACGRGAVLAKKPGTVCSRCYALRGHYLNASVVTAHARRLAALANPLWADAMAVLIDAYARGGHFRWFDAGDICSARHLDQILWIARRTRTVLHWLPTHERGYVAAVRQRIPQNLTIRISADAIERMPAGTLGLPTSTVHTVPAVPVRAATAKRGDSIECLAYTRGHHCGGCRACWSKDVRNVSYLLNAGLRAPSRETKRFHLSVVA